MAISSLNSLPNAHWNERTARHLLNRAGFGIPRRNVEVLAALSAEDAVTALVDFDSVPSQFAPPDFLPDPASTTDESSMSMTGPVRRAAMRARVAEERPIVRRLRGWWLQRMAETPRPLEEKLTLFWHGHFATSAQKVKFAYLNYHLNDTFRKYAAGNFKDLTTAVAQSPAMLRYLDNNRNVKGSPNENWARELMELFTMGPGNYTENDVKESARAFTGWTFNETGFLVRTAKHDEGVKTFLGRRGNFDGYDVIDILFEQPATAEFLVTKLWTFFAYENPEPGIVTELAADLQANDYELRPLLRKMFLSRAFYSERAVGSRIKSPVECVLHAAEDLRLNKPPYQYMAQLAAELGQDLFFPPNVKGWDGGRAWINANSLLQRYNLPPAMVAATLLDDAEADAAMPQMANGYGRIGRRARELLATAPPDRARYYRVQLKDAPAEERRALLLEALMELSPPGVWQVERAFEALEDDTAEKCVDALAHRLLSRPLSNTQRDHLVRTLAPDGVLPESGPQREHMLATLRLMMSLTEYQLG